jgi:hypothetical protein
MEQQVQQEEQSNKSNMEWSNKLGMSEATDWTRGVEQQVKWIEQEWSNRLSNKSRATNQVGAEQ